MKNNTKIAKEKLIDLAIFFGALAAFAITAFVFRNIVIHDLEQLKQTSLINK